MTAPAEAQLPRRPWQVRDLFIGGALFIALFAAVIVAVALADPDGGNDVALAVLTAAFEFGLGGIVGVLALWRRVGLRELGFRRPARWSPLVAAWLGAYVVIVVYQVAVAALEEAGVDMSNFNEGNAIPVEDERSTLALVILGIGVVAGAPLGEELFFRAFLYRGMRVVWRMGLALAVSGFLFGAFHVNLSVLVPYTLVGMLFAWAYEDTGSLWTAIAAHAAVNGLAFALLVAGVEE